MTLSERVKVAMERAGCDVPALAFACRITAPSVHGWINGSSKSMAAGPCLRAAAYLGVSPLWLAEGEGPMLPGGKSILVPVGAASVAKHARKGVQKICDIAEKISEFGLKHLLLDAERRLEEFPLTKGRKKGKAA